MIFCFSDSPVQIQATSLGFGHRQWKTNELCEFGLTIHETDYPTCSSGEEREESLSSRWPQKRTLSLSLGLSLQEAPFPLLPAVSHTVTRGLAGIDEQVRVPEKTEGSERERRGSGGTRNEMRGLGQAAGESDIFIDESPGRVELNPARPASLPAQLPITKGPPG
ncbi:hypothetical protein M9H77_24435 [Catharanthus roseus]|uniref:Uncharacterized protein n=1 Tax=Catharanthus roseus TaxID=4058 RepID=A0ACC0AVP4_CATRO|nr:hypothetical protein M9H77_24435 [Catharanthus roseus]